MSEKRPYYNPETREIKVMTEEEARKLNEKEEEEKKQNDEKLAMRKLKLGDD